MHTHVIHNVSGCETFKNKINNKVYSVAKVI